MSVIINKWNDGSGDSINIESPSFQGNQTIKISSLVQKGTSKRSMRFIGKCKKDSSKQVILTVEQEASIYTYDLTLNSDNTEIAAKGGTTTITAVLKTYRNGNLVSTDNVTPVLSGSATGFSISGVTVTASNRTITVGSRRSIIVTGEYSNTFDGQIVSSTITIYQAENKVTNSNYNPRITAYGTPTISIGSGLTPAGGSATISASVTNTETYNALYSSGATGPNQTRSVGGSLSISMTANGNNRFSLSGNTITHSSMGTNTTTDIVTIKAVNDGDSSKSATASTNIPNFRIGRSTSGGVYTYGSVTAGTITHGMIPASGGSARATAGNGTQSWNKSETITTYKYLSGATEDVVTENASSGITEIIPNVAYIEATASSKGTTISSQTTVKSQNFGWYGYDDESASGTMHIYQEANFVIDDHYDDHLSSYGTPEIVIGSNLITAAGGTARAAGVVRNTYTYYDLYASGSTVPHTRTEAGVYKIEMISNGNNRFSMDDTYLITHLSMGTNITTDTAEFRCYNEGDRTKYADYSIYVSNRIESYDYDSWNISISASPIYLPATGGTSTIISNCTGSKTPIYTSGSTGTTIKSETPTLALTVDPGGFTLIGNKLTAANNNTTKVKTAGVTASCSGADPRSVVVIQRAAQNGIGYMQIQGDGTRHPIFRVDGNTRSVEPMSINETSETTSDEDVSISANINKFLTKFV